MGSGMALDWQSGELAEGLGCYERGEFFVAHEHWELAWLRLSEPEKSFLQAMIQVTAAFHHWERGNVAGTLSLLRRVQRRLDGYPAVFGGMDVRRLRGEIEEWVRGMGSGEVPGAYPVIGGEGSCSRS